MPYLRGFTQVTIAQIPLDLCQNIYMVSKEDTLVLMDPSGIIRCIEMEFDERECGDKTRYRKEIRIESLCFEWDERKNKSNIQKHGISFEIAAYIFFDINFIGDI